VVEISTAGGAKESGSNVNGMPQENAVRGGSTFSANCLARLLIIALLGVIAYSNTFFSPFHFDDPAFIVNNPIIKDFDYFLEPSMAARVELPHIVPATWKTRYMGFLSFWANYRLHGLNVTGYHIVNLAIHLLNAAVVYLLVLVTLNTPFLRGSVSSEQARRIALFPALLFVTHPVQTQAITYICQRFASLAALFYMLSLLLYAASGISRTAFRRRLLYSICLVSAVLAMNTKEIAFTLPLAIALYDVMFLRGHVVRRTLRLLPLLLTMLIIPINLIEPGRPFLEAVSEASRSEAQQELLRWKYLIVQFRVTITYLRLLFLPVNQNLDYDYFRFSVSFLFQSLLSFMFLLTMLLYVIRIFRRFRDSLPLTRLVAYGIFWFFLTLSVESGVVPIGNLIFEHRLYLPSAGVFMAASVAVFLIMRGLRAWVPRTAVVAVIVLIPLIMTAASYARNDLWKSEIRLWEDTTSKSPRKPRTWFSLGTKYLRYGKPGEAISAFKKSIKLEPEHKRAIVSLGNAYRASGRPDLAIEQYRAAIMLDPEFFEAYLSLAFLYYDLGIFDESIKYYMSAIALMPGDPMAHNDLGNAYVAGGHIEKAIKHYHEALRLKPDDPLIHNNIANAYGLKGMASKAIEHYKISLSLSPDNADMHYNLGLAYLDSGLADEARLEFERVLEINPDDRQAINQLDRLGDSSAGPP
jgi:tetratricopeptide (TPR) repeat protein